jgi:hypothetical protein
MFCASQCHKQSLVRQKKNCTLALGNINIQYLHTCIILVNHSTYFVLYKTQLAFGSYSECMCHDIHCKILKCHFTFLV